MHCSLSIKPGAAALTYILTSSDWSVTSLIPTTFSSSPGLSELNSPRYRVFLVAIPTNTRPTLSALHSQVSRGKAVVFIVGDYSFFGCIETGLPVIATLIACIHFADCTRKLCESTGKNCRQNVDWALRTIMCENISFLGPDHIGTTRGVCVGWGRGGCREPEASPPPSWRSSSGPVQLVDGF